MFQKARLKLTAYYILIIMTISAVISGAFYYRANIIFNNEYQRIENRVERQRQMMPPNAQPPMFEVSPEEISNARKNLALQLLQINALVISLTAFASYILSGITLKPIQEVMLKQQQFIADASHELKTPLTSLITSIEVSLLDKKLSKSTKELLQDNLDDIKSLHKLTESLLALSRLNDSLILKPHSLKSILTNSINNVSSIAKKKKIKITLGKLSKETEVNCDKLSLEELFTNLLDNSLKYSKSGTNIKIKSKIAQNSVSINIIDQGYGIAKKHIPHIFDRFYRIDEARGRNSNNGHGLGLSLAKQIVINHKGSINIVSELDQGSTFTVTLPLA